MELTLAETTKRGLTIYLNKDFIIKDLRYRQTAFSENKYCPALEIPETEEEYMNKEQYQKAYEDMIQFVQEITEDDLKRYIENQARKKNGTFRKNSVQRLYACEASEYITEWNNTWIYAELRAKAVSDTDLIIELYTKTDTPA